MAWPPLSRWFQSKPMRAQRVGDDADRRREHEQPQHAGDRRRHRVGPDQQRLVDRGAAHHAVGHDRQHQRDAEAEHGDQHREHRGDLERLEVGRVGEQPPKFSRPTNSVRGAEGILHQHALLHRLRRRPEEEHDDDHHLRRHQRPGQPRSSGRGRAFRCHLSPPSRLNGD